MSTTAGASANAIEGPKSEAPTSAKIPAAPSVPTSTPSWLPRFRPATIPGISSSEAFDRIYGRMPTSASEAPAPAMKEKTTVGRRSVISRPAIPIA
ncbi:hypothetical protein GCM10023068_31720 [Leifsonia shinshuensis]